MHVKEKYDDLGERLIPILPLVEGIRESLAEEVTDTKHVITSVMSAIEQCYGDAGKNNLTQSRGSGTAALRNQCLN